MVAHRAFDNNRIRLGDLARNLLGNREYGSFGSYILRAKNKDLEYAKEDRRENNMVKCPRCGHNFFDYKIGKY